MRCQWHPMHETCSVIETSCIVCGVIDTACTMNAGSLTPRAWCMLNEIFEQLWKSKNQRRNGFAMQKMKNSCSVIDTACTVQAVSLTIHAKYDTGCTIDERYERSWHPLKWISIKNMDTGICKLSYPTTTKIYKYKGIILTKRCRACGVIDTACTKMGD
jgi:hypothetical protein